MQTASGRQFWPLDPRANEVFIEDIAHHLSNQCRYAGATKLFYSVAQHSVLVSQNVPEKDALSGLLHDAAEAYTADLIRPIKNNSALGDAFKEVEAKVWLAVCERFQIPVEEPESVRTVDKYTMIVTEQRDVMRMPPRAWQEDGHEPLRERIIYWSPENAHSRFLRRFFELTCKGIEEQALHTLAYNAYQSTRGY
jgi:hypothetical protein